MKFYKIIYGNNGYVCAIFSSKLDVKGYLKSHKGMKLAVEIFEGKIDTLENVGK